MSDNGFRAGGYTLVLPPGWVRVPVNGDTDKTLDAAIDRALPADLPRDDAARLRVKIKGRLLKAAAEGRDIGTLDIYLPLEGMRGLALPASFLVTEIPVAPDRHQASAIKELIGTGAAEITVDGLAGLRLDDIVRSGLADE